MMQEDSNGESSFEFVNKKVLDEPPAENAAAATQASANLLSAVPPPSALPSFVLASPALSTEAQAETTANAPAQKVPPVSIQPLQNFPAPTFTAAIAHSPGTGPTESAQNVGDELSAGASLLGWMKGAVGSGGLLSKVAEKAKNSVDSMITTLDPQMREFIYSGGDIDVVVASDKEVKISAIREAFQSVFGRATVTGQESQPKMIAAQPVGFAAATRAADERIASVRPNVPEHVPVIAVENFLLEVAEEKWFDLGVLLLDDPSRKIHLQAFTQLTPVPARVVERAQVDTPSDYPLRWSGLSVPIGKLMAEHLQVSAGEWHLALTGVARREMLLLAATSLAGLYKNALTMK